MTPAKWFVTIACLVSVVNDGWSGRPSPLVHQILMLPLLLLYGSALAGLLIPNVCSEWWRLSSLDIPTWWLTICASFEAVSLISFGYEAHHFQRFGYHLTAAAIAVLAALFAAMVVMWFGARSAPTLLLGALALYCAGAIVAVLDFPLNYLRSDMLPVIVWADQRLAGHLNPYSTIHVADRLYDFPYLPGVLVAYLPIVAAHLDPRWLNLLCVLVTAVVLYLASRPVARGAAAALISVFILSPFLQYRHDLYLQPHWLALAGSVVLLHRGRWRGGAVVFGFGMAIYQLSWVLWPFLLLYGLRRRGWRAALEGGVLSLGAMALVVGPFLTSAIKRIANNTVGQWSRLPHALADPINLSYWVTFLIRPDQLKWLQLGVLVLLFGVCVARGSCRTLEDTLRWMSVALAIFIALNVIVDGYFYLTLLLLLLMYTLAATHIWDDNADGLGNAALA